MRFRRGGACPDCWRGGGNHNTGCPYAPEPEQCSYCGEEHEKGDHDPCPAEEQDSENAQETRDEVETALANLREVRDNWRPSHPTARDELQPAIDALEGVLVWLSK